MLTTVRFINISMVKFDNKYKHLSKILLFSIKKEVLRGSVSLPGLRARHSGSLPGCAMQTGQGHGLLIFFCFVNFVETISDGQRHYRHTEPIFR